MTKFSMDRVVDLSDGRELLTNVDSDEWRVQWSCGCAIYTGWWSDTNEAGVLAWACADPGPHAAPLRRAVERYADMVAHPTEHRELGEVGAVDVLRAIANDERAAS